MYTNIVTHLFPILLFKLYYLVILIFVGILRLSLRKTYDESLHLEGLYRNEFSQRVLKSSRGVTNSLFHVYHILWESR